MRTRSRRTGVGLLVGAAVVVAALAGGGVAWARSGGSPGYRTAAVTRGSVTATMTLAGTITPLQSASVGFAQSGTVASVDVAVGQTVTAGQTLASLDLTPLQAKLTSAEATEAAARQTLAEAEDGQLPSGSGPGSSGGPSSGAAGAGHSGSGASSAAVTSAQKAVESAQQAVDQAQDAARSALAAATSACGDPGNGGGSGDGGGGNGGGGGTGTSDCLSTETAAMQAEDTLSTRQNALASAQSSLAGQLTKATSAATGGDASSSSGTVSAAQLAQYQAALGADTAAAAVAQQNLDQGTAVSPLSGTVVSVGVTPGESVSAASSTQIITVSSPNGFAVDATVPTADIASVSVGQHASVAPDGVTGALAASLTSISPTATSSGFAVVFGLSGTGTTLRPGASATVTLTTGRAIGAVVVPTSAVHVLGTRSVVEVLGDGAPQPAVVTLGVRGPLHTQVTSGLKLGQQVVLADLSSTVTSDSSTTTGARTGLGGVVGLGGAGRPRAGGGFTGRAGSAVRQGAGG